MQKINTSIFIERSIKIHGNKYDYSKSEYTGRPKKLKIICKIHGEFDQSAGHHLQGQGCKKCGLFSMSEKIQKQWDHKDDLFLINNYFTMTAPKLSILLNKTIHEIYHRTKFLKLEKNSKKLNHLYISGRMWSNLISNAKNRNLKIDISPDNIINQYNKQNKKCSLSGIELEFSNNSKLNTASVDRIDSTKGYTIDNIQIVHKLINQSKMDNTDKEFYNICKSVYLNLKNKYE
jgi:hypothetical protein